MKMQHSRIIAFLTTIAFAPLLQATTLEEIYQQAVLNDHSFRAAQATLEAGKENTGLGRAGLLPKLNAQGSWQDSHTERTGTGANIQLGALPQETDGTRQGYGVTLSQPLFDLAAWHSYKRAKAASNIAEAQFGIAEQQLIIRTAQAYFDVLQAVDNLDTARAEENAFSYQLEQTRQRFEVGLVAITEVHEAQAVYDSATAERLIAEGRLGIAFEALEVITGSPQYELAPLKNDLPVTPPAPEERSAWVEMALQNNYNLRVASLTAESAKQFAKAQKAGHFPTVSLDAGYSDYNNDSDINGINSDIDQEDQSIGVTLTIPLYNGGGVSAARRKAAQEYIASRELLNQTQRDIVQQTRSVHLTVVTSVTTVKARLQAITSNQSAYEATQAGYDVGTRDLVDVLNAQRNLFRAQRDFYDALYAYVLSTLRLKEAAGTLSPTDVSELNSWLDMSRTVNRDAS